MYTHKRISPLTKFVVNTPKPTRGGTRCTYNSIDRECKAFFWAGIEEIHGSKCLVAWKHVCWPKELGPYGEEYRIPEESAEEDPSAASTEQMDEEFEADVITSTP